MSKKKKTYNKNKNKKKKSSPRKTNTKDYIREKVCGEPTPVKSIRPVSEYYNTQTNEIYPKIFFRQDSLWTKIKRFFGYLP